MISLINDGVVVFVTTKLYFISFVSEGSVLPPLTEDLRSVQRKLSRVGYRSSKIPYAFLLLSEIL